MRSSNSVSRLLNLRIDPQPQEPASETRSQGKRKTPIITLFGVQAMPAELRFAIGEYVLIRKQPSGMQDPSELPTPASNLLSNYDSEFPALGAPTRQQQSNDVSNKYISKHAGCCVGRVVSIRDAPLSIKVKLVSPSYSPQLSLPRIIKECLQQHRQIFFELQMILANVSKFSA